MLTLVALLIRKTCGDLVFWWEKLSNEILAFNIEILLYPILYIKNRDSSQTKDLACIQFPENYTQIRLYITRMKRSSVNLAKLVVIYLFVCTWDKGFKPTLSKPTRSDELSNNYILFHCIVANSNHIDYLILWLLNSSLNIGWKKTHKKANSLYLLSFIHAINSRYNMPANKTHFCVSKRNKIKNCHFKILFY